MCLLVADRENHKRPDFFSKSWTLHSLLRNWHLQGCHTFKVWMALPTKYHPWSLFPSDGRDLNVWTSTWYFHSYILFSGIFCYVSKNHFPLYPKVRGSQFWQHGDQDIDWETFFYLLVYLPDLVNNVIYRLSKKKQQHASLINKEYLYVRV